MVASQGGAPQHPAWYFNLSDDPEVVLQDGADVQDMSARTATGDERPALWSKVVEAWPDYDKYQASTDRVIPVVVLEPR